MTKLIPLSVEGKFAIVDDGDYDHLLNWKWTYVKYKDGNEYAKRAVLRNGKYVCIFMQYEVMGTRDGFIIDHINLNSLDNTRANLRWATYSQNLHNKRVYKNNTTGYKGVVWYKARNKWTANISVNGKHKFLGYFDDIMDAVRAYDEAAIKYLGEFARPNLP